MKNQEFKVGDRVWSFIFGWGAVEEIDSEIMYPVYVNFDSGKTNTHTTDGFYLLDHESPTLFHANQGKIEFDTNEPIDLEDGQPIWVRGSEKREWIPRHFARYSQIGGVFCYLDGNSKHTTKGETYVKRWEFFRTTDPALDGESDD